MKQSIAYLKMFAAIWLQKAWQQTPIEMLVAAILLLLVSTVLPLLMPLITVLGCVGAIALLSMFVIKMAIGLRRA